MGTIKEDKVNFNETELSLAAKLKEEILQRLQKDADVEDIDISVEIAVDSENGNVTWGHVYAPQKSDSQVWRILDDAKMIFAHSHGFPETLIDVLPV